MTWEDVTGAAKRCGVDCEEARRITDGLIAVERTHVSLHSNELHALVFERGGQRTMQFAPSRMPLEQQLTEVAGKANIALAKSVVDPGALTGDRATMTA